MNYFEKKLREWRMLKTFWPSKSWAWRLKNIQNFVDDPVDEIKHKLHGAKIFGYVIRLPKWLMPGSGDDTK